MNEIWVLTIKTSLPKTCCNASELKSNILAFDSFEKGRDAFRETIKSYAFSQNSMFNGEGDIIHLQKYLNDMPDEEYIDDGEVLDKYRLGYVCDALKDIFSGKDVEFEMQSEYCTDWFIAISSEPGMVHFYGEDDGPCNGYDPYIHTNAFSMKDEKDYFLYIDDLFGQDYSSELYIDLRKAEVK